MTQLCPPRAIGHLTDPGYRAGNSIEGNKHAARRGIGWVDNDWQPKANTHWVDPRKEGYLPASDTRRWLDLTSAEIAALRSPDGYGVRTMEQAFRDAKAYGQNVEAEAKFNCTAAQCRELAADARDVFGDAWKKRVWVKTLTDLPGGYDAALARLKAAKAAGFTTLLLLRGADRARRQFPDYVDFVRGATAAPLPPKEAAVSTGIYLEDNKPARSQFRTGRRAKPTGLFVIHTAEGVMDAVGADTGAEGVARFIRDRDTPGSYHRLVDSDSVVALIRLSNEAYGDGTGSNPYAIHVSFACKTSDWVKMTPAKRAAFLRNGAKAVVEGMTWLKREHGITVPLKRVTRAQSTAGAAGFIPHGDRDPGRRSDPGANFPWTQFFAEIKALLGTTSSPAPVPEKTPTKPRPTAATLRAGSHGPVVEALQRGLNRVFPTYSRLVVDGDFGRATEKVVKEFQRRAGLTADGAIGPKTRAALNKHGVRF